jgi:alpha-beta hydrolase superfamily lysophospholipase
VAISSALLKDSDSMCLLDDDIDLTIPVTLMHGKQDQDVSWQKSERLAELLRKTSVETIFVPDGDHRLARAEDLSILKQAVLLPGEINITPIFLVSGNNTIIVQG